MKIQIASIADNEPRIFIITTPRWRITASLRYICVDGWDDTTEHTYFTWAYPFKFKKIIPNNL